MNKLTSVNTFLLTLFITVPFTSSAESWSCKHDNDIREIQITHEPSSPVPCSVIYKKPTEGLDDQVLWTANNDAGYCDEKAQAFVEKQTSWGWACTEVMANTDPAPTENTEPMPSESTEAMPTESSGSGSLESSSIESQPTTEPAN